MLRRLTSAVHVTAARLRFCLNPNGPVWAAARDGDRYCDTRSRFVLLDTTGSRDPVMVSCHLSPRCGGVIGNGEVSSTQQALEPGVAHGTDCGE
jgi:hypothetical protein